LIQLVKTPTRGSNILDLVLTCQTDIISDLRVTQPFLNSDHNAIEFYLEIPKIISQSPKSHVIDYHKGIYEELNTFFANHPWHELIKIEEDISLIYTKFIQVINIGVGKFIPTFERSGKIKKEFIPKYIEKALHHRANLYHRIENPGIREKYNKLSKNIEKEMNKFARYKENKILSKTLRI
jgi:hypothetical protein